MKEDAENDRIVGLGRYEIQAKWLAVGIDNMRHKDLTWNKILYQCSDRLLKFIVNAIPGWLPSPDNLRRWKSEGEHKCGLCGRFNATLAHILCGCPWVREMENKSGKEDRFTWRHNCILAILAKSIRAKLQQINGSPVLDQKKTLVRFVPAGTTNCVRKKPQDVPSLLSQARDWEADFDLPELRSNGSIFAFPYDVCATTLRADAYIISRASKFCFVGPELTAPMEENIHEWHKKKRAKYDSIQLSAEANSWRIQTLVLERESWIFPSLFSRFAPPTGFSKSRN